MDSAGPAEEPDPVVRECLKRLPERLEAGNVLVVEPPGAGLSGAVEGRDDATVVGALEDLGGLGDDGTVEDVGPFDDGGMLDDVGVFEALETSRDAESSGAAGPSPDAEASGAAGPSPDAEASGGAGPSPDAEASGGATDDDGLVVVADLYLACRQYHASLDEDLRTAFESLLERERSLCLFVRPRALDWLVERDLLPVDDADRFLDRFELEAVRYDAERAAAVCRDRYDATGVDPDALDRLAYRYRFEAPPVRGRLERYDTYVPSVVPLLHDHADGGAVFSDSVGRFLDGVPDDGVLADFVGRVGAAGRRLVRRLGADEHRLELMAGLASALPSPLSMVGAPVLLWLLVSDREPEDDLRSFLRDVVDEDLPPNTRAKLEEALGLPPMTIESLGACVRERDYARLQRVADSVRTAHPGAVEAIRDELDLGPAGAALGTRVETLRSNLDALREDVEAFDALLSPGLSNAVYGIDRVARTVQADEEQYSGVAAPVDSIPLFGPDRVGAVLDAAAESPVVVLRGPHGTGKTTTAIRACRAMEERGYRVCVPNLREEPLRFVRHRLAADTTRPTVLFAAYRRGAVPSVSGDDVVSLLSLVEDGTCETLLVECRDELYPELESTVETAGGVNTWTGRAGEVPFGRVEEDAVGDIVGWMVRQHGTDVEESELRPAVRDVADGNPEIAKIAARLWLEGEDLGDVETWDELVLHDVSDVLAGGTARRRQQKAVFEHLAMANELTGQQLMDVLNLTPGDLTDCRRDLAGYLGSEVRDARPVTGEETWRISPDVYQEVAFRKAVLREDRLEPCLANVLSGLDEPAALAVLGEVATNLAIAFEEGRDEPGERIVEATGELLGTVLASGDRAAYAECLGTLVEGTVPVPLARFDADAVAAGLDRVHDEDPPSVSGAVAGLAAVLAANHVLAGDGSAFAAVFDRLDEFEARHRDRWAEADGEFDRRRFLAVVYRVFLERVAEERPPDAVADWLDRVEPRLFGAVSLSSDSTVDEAELAAPGDDASEEAVEFAASMVRDDVGFALNFYTVLAEAFVGSGSAELVGEAMDRYVRFVREEAGVEGVHAVVQFAWHAAYPIFRTTPPDEGFELFRLLREACRSAAADHEHPARTMQLFYLLALGWVFPPDENKTYLGRDVWVVHGRISESRRRAWWAAILDDGRSVLGETDTEERAFVRLLAVLGGRLFEDEDPSDVESHFRSGGGVDLVYSTLFRGATDRTDVLLLTVLLLDAVVAEHAPGDLHERTAELAEVVRDGSDGPVPLDAERRNEVLGELLRSSPRDWYLGLRDQVGRAAELFDLGEGWLLHFHALAVVVPAREWSPRGAAEWLDAVFADAWEYAAAASDRRDYLAVWLGAATWVLGQDDEVEERGRWLVELELRASRLGAALGEDVLEEVLAAGRPPSLDGEAADRFLDRTRELWVYYENGGLVDSTAALEQLVRESTPPEAGPWFEFLFEEALGPAAGATTEFRQRVYDRLFEAMLGGYCRDPAAWVAELEAAVEQLPPAGTGLDPELAFYWSGLSVGAPVVPADRGRAWFDRLADDLDAVVEDYLDVPLDGDEDSTVLSGMAFGALVADMALNRAPAECRPWVDEVEERARARIENAGGWLRTVRNRFGEAVGGALGGALDEVLTDRKLRIVGYARFYALPVALVAAERTPDGAGGWFDELDRRASRTAEKRGYGHELVSHFYQDVLMMLPRESAPGEVVAWVDEVERRARASLPDGEDPVEHWTKFYVNVTSSLLDEHASDDFVDWFDVLMERAAAVGERFEDLDVRQFLVLLFVSLVFASEVKDVPVGVGFVEAQAKRWAGRLDGGEAFLADFYAYLSVEGEGIPSADAAEWRRDVDARVEAAAATVRDGPAFRVRYRAQRVAVLGTEASPDERAELFDEARSTVRELAPPSRSDEPLADFYAQCVVGTAEWVAPSGVEAWVDRVLDAAARDLDGRPLGRVYRTLLAELVGEAGPEWTGLVLDRDGVLVRAVRSVDSPDERADLVATVAAGALETVADAPETEGRAVYDALAARLRELETAAPDVAAAGVAAVPADGVEALPDEVRSRWEREFGE